MPVISMQDIPMDVKRPHLERRKKELKQALLSPALTEEQHAQITQELKNLGKEKEYGDHIPFPVGAIELPE